jgi:predicted metal-dependent hydrolase
VVTAPTRTTREEIRQVVLKRAQWITRKLAERASRPPRKEFVGGETLPYLGRDLPLTVEEVIVRRPALTLDHAGFHLTLPARLDAEKRREAAEKTVTTWCKAEALRCLSERTQHWSGVAGYAPSEVLVREQRRRWGSCGGKGVLRFNWRLIMAPLAVVDYVVVHELAHVRVRNHSAVFWAEVARLMPDYRARRKLLRELGSTLTI